MSGPLPFDLRRLVVSCLLGVASVLPAAAADISLAWDANAETDLAGYVVLVGTASGVYSQSLEVGPSETASTVSGLAPGVRYYFAVRAFNTTGLQSGLSNEVSVLIPGATTSPMPVVKALSPAMGPVTGGTVVTITGSGFLANTTVTFGGMTGSVTSATSSTLTVVTPARSAGTVSVVVRNPDGQQGVSAAGFTYTSNPPDQTDGGAAPFVRYFAEGVRGSFFSTRFALVNPHEQAVTGRLTLTDTFGQETEVPVDLPAGSRITLDGTNLPPLSSEAFGSRFELSHPVGIDRTVEWDAAVVYGAHSETGIAEPRTSWYLAEGATHSGFNLFYLLQNSTDETAEVRVRYLLAGGGVIEKAHVVAPKARTNVWVNKDDPALASAEMSAHLESTNGVPIVVERSMYLDSGGQLFTAGHNSGAVAEPATRWFLAEGATGDYFDTFVLVANPNDDDAELQVTYLLGDGSPVERTHLVPANSRYTIWVDQDDPRLARADVSTVVESTNEVPIIVERAMWWPGTPGGPWTEAHNSAASTATASRWVMADGQASASAWTFVLVANTDSEATTVRVTLLGTNGRGRSVDAVVGGQQRFSIDVAGTFPEAMGTRFGVLVESLDEAPLVVERATYSDGAGIRWAAGTNSLGTPLP